MLPKIAPQGHHGRSEHPIVRELVPRKIWLLCADEGHGNEGQVGT
jgi:hypothetical protein